MGTPIGVYDHDTTKEVRGSLVKKIAGASSCFQMVNWHLKEEPTDESTVVTELLNDHIVIGHFDSDIHWRDLIGKSESTAIRVRTSTAGRTGHTHTNEQGVLVLQLQPAHTDVTTDNWRAIIAHLLTAGAAQKIVDGDVSAEMAPFFGTGNLEILPALSILCQGYLVVLANSDVGKDERDTLKEWVLADRDFSAKVQEVQQSEFWDVFGDKKEREALLERVRREGGWKEGDRRFSHTEKLVSAIVQRRPMEDPEDPNMIAQAHREIAAKLGANSGG